MVMEVCSHHRWTLTQWTQLPGSEKELWLLWNMRRKNRLNEFYNSLAEGKHNTPEAVTLIRIALDLA